MTAVETVCVTAPVMAAAPTHIGRSRWSDAENLKEKVYEKNKSATLTVKMDFRGVGLAGRGIFADLLLHSLQAGFGTQSHQTEFRSETAWP